MPLVIRTVQCTSFCLALKRRRKFLVFDRKGFLLFSCLSRVPVRMWMVADIQIDRDSRQLADKSRTRTEQKAKSPVKPSEDLTASLAFLVFIFLPRRRALTQQTTS